MKIATVTVRGTAPYSASRFHEAPKLEKETADAYENRTWREKGHYTPEGEMFIPAMGFKQAVDKAAKMLGLQVPGKGKSTYTKHFLAGCVVTDHVRLGVHKNDVPMVRVHCNADGVRGSGKRVMRSFPEIASGWGGTVAFALFDEAITKEVFEKVLAEAGKYVGVGRFRAENGGLNGRFAVDSIEWSEA